MNLKLGKFLLIDNVTDSLEIWNQQLEDDQVVRDLSNLLDKEITSKNCVVTLFLVAEGQFKIILDMKEIVINKDESILIFGEQTFTVRGLVDNTKVRYMTYEY